MVYIIPEYIKVGWKEYNIYLDSEHTRQPCEGVTDATCGLIDSNSQFIAIDNTLSEAQQEVTLLHEIIHAMDDMYGLGFDDDRYVERLSNAIYSLLRENGYVIVKKS